MTKLMVIHLVGSIIAGAVSDMGSAGIKRLFKL